MGRDIDIRNTQNISAWKKLLRLVVEEDRGHIEHRLK